MAAISIFCLLCRLSPIGPSGPRPRPGDFKVKTDTKAMPHYSQATARKYTTRSLACLSLSLSLSLPGGENWGRSVPSPPRASAHLSLSLSLTILLLPLLTLPLSHHRQRSEGTSLSLSLLVFKALPCCNALVCTEAILNFAQAALSTALPCALCKQPGHIRIRVRAVSAALCPCLSLARVLLSFLDCALEKKPLPKRSWQEIKHATQDLEALCALGTRA